MSDPVTQPLASVTEGRRRPLPPPMSLDLAPGAAVELAEDQVFADRVVVKAGEPGTALYPSSQAAAWVVRFPKVGSKLRVIPERLLRLKAQ